MVALGVCEISVRAVLPAPPRPRITEPVGYSPFVDRRLKPDVVVIGFFMNDAMPFGETVAHHRLVTETPAEVSSFGRISALWRLLEQRASAARRTSRYLRDLRHSFSSERWRDAEGRMAKLRTMAHRDGFQIVAVIFPLLYNLNDDYPLEAEHARVRSAFASAGIEAVDMLDSFRGRNAVDPHPNEIAHALAAERLARWLETFSAS